ncbi:hypothetical protein [Thalassobellus sediminis]|uniref:hypothetical protein n=1 Tax=Thalassobellus sediminis TaxID=3367753 RepID=UPI0037BD6CDB
MRKIAFSICLLTISISTSYAQTRASFLLETESEVLKTNNTSKFYDNINLCVTQHIN